ncbi:uncharacterized protein LOC110973277 [Acanthaster planci]|uniref:Uncharacterized protein LOC110973277 n=1 Tax=Acanthaster planci TaxID=133434 RepID=A0A8B7XHG0_ACAPL|nr:uncharacterized protein LOC110973277 [Acanthaster planci]
MGFVRELQIPMDVQTIARTFLHTVTLLAAFLTCTVAVHDSHCPFNCTVFAEPSLRVTIDALVNTTVPGITRPFTYRWSLQVLDAAHGVYADVLHWETGLIYSDSTTCTIIFKEDFLERGRDYRVTYHVTTPVFQEMKTDRTDVLVRTNHSPIGGHCRVFPTSGMGSRAAYRHITPIIP